MTRRAASGDDAPAAFLPAPLLLLSVSFHAQVLGDALFYWQGPLVDAGENPTIIPGPTAMSFPSAGQNPVASGGASVTLPAGLTDRFLVWEFYVTDLTGANRITVSSTGNGVLLAEGPNTIVMDGTNSEAGAPTGTDLTFDAGAVVSAAGGAFLVTCQFGIRGPD